MIINRILGNQFSGKAGVGFHPPVTSLVSPCPPLHAKNGRIYLGALGALDTLALSINESQNATCCCRASVVPAVPEAPGGQNSASRDGLLKTS